MCTVKRKIGFVHCFLENVCGGMEETFTTHAWLLLIYHAFCIYFILVVDPS